MKIVINKCYLCGGDPKLNMGHSYHFKTGSKTDMHSCAVQCRGCGTKIPKGGFFDDPDGSAKARRDAAKRWNELHKEEA